MKITKQYRLRNIAIVMGAIEEGSMVSQARKYNLSKIRIRQIVDKIFREVKIHMKPVKYHTIDVTNTGKKYDVYRMPWLWKNIMEDKDYLLYILKKYRNKVLNEKE
jgi:hypothetical protein